MTDATPKTRGAHHIGLTVPDLGDARNFFIDALGYRQVGADPEYPAVFLSDGTIMITLWQAENPTSVTPFDRRRNLGLHHLALRVVDLDALADELSRRSDVSIEFPPEGLGDTGIKHMMCLIPGNLRVEFIAA